MVTAFPVFREPAAAGVPGAGCWVLSDHSLDRWRKDPVSQRGWDDAHVIDVPLSLHEDDPTLAQRRLSPRCGCTCQVLGTFLHSAWTMIWAGAASSGQFSLSKQDPTLGITSRRCGGTHLA